MGSWTWPAILTRGELEKLCLCTELVLRTFRWLIYLSPFRSNSIESVADEFVTCKAVKRSLAARNMCGLWWMRCEDSHMMEFGLGWDHSRASGRAFRKGPRTPSFRKSKFTTATPKSMVVAPANTQSSARVRTYLNKLPPRDLATHNLPIRKHKPQLQPHLQKRVYRQLKRPLIHNIPLKLRTRD